MQFSPAMVIVVIGLVLVALGLLAMTGLFDWFGRLPGDIRIERGGTRIYIPISSMIIVSVVLTVVINVVWRLFR